MSLLVATHHGAFHADDVLAFALIRAFVDPQARLVRSRSPEDWAAADVVIDVGGVYDPGRRRFDHHQKEYSGPLSAAGMVLGWLESSGRVEPDRAALLRERLVDYVDDVDNGRVELRPAVPCFAAIVHLCNLGAVELADFDARFDEAVSVAMLLLRGLNLEHEERVAARALVEQAMEAASRRGDRVLRLPRYLRWKPAYFALGGAEHPTDFVLMPGLDGTARAIAIPPQENSFAQKRPLPEAWAGLVDEDLARVAGVPGARFCHKNRFICVWDSMAGLEEALARAGLLAPPRS